MAQVPCTFPSGFWQTFIMKGKFFQISFSCCLMPTAKFLGGMGGEKEGDDILVVFQGHITLNSEISLYTGKEETVSSKV